MLNSADPAFLARLAADLPPDTLRATEPRYLEEPRSRWTGQAGALALPRSTDEVARIVQIAAMSRVGIVPWGGGTGLVGGQVMPDGPKPLLVSLERMAALRGTYPQEKTLLVEAGMVVATAQGHAAVRSRDDCWRWARWIKQRRREAGRIAKAVSEMVDFMVNVLHWLCRTLTFANCGRGLPGRRLPPP